MRRPYALALLAAAGLAAAGCSTSPCQRLGEKLCGCTGQTSQTCSTQVENQLKAVNPDQVQLDQCQVLFDRCNQPVGAVFCEWVNVEAGQIACGLAPDPSTIPTT